MEKDRDYKGSAHHVHEQVPWYLRIHSTALSVVCGGVGTAVATAVTGPAAAISAVAKGQNGLKAYTNSVSNGWYGGCEEGSVLSTGKWRPID